MFPTTLVINNGTSLTTSVTGLDKYTEYEFQVLAFTSVGDGPKSSIKVARTKEDGKNFKELRNGQPILKKTGKFFQVCRS